jgi:peptidyl-prolyl cis-trans isomerase A (cyclophilin A)
VLEYNKAQGDPMGSIDLKTALAGDPKLEDDQGQAVRHLRHHDGQVSSCELYEDKAPNTVANFVGLARGVRPYYDKKADAWKTGPFFDGIAVPPRDRRLHDPDRRPARRRPAPAAPAT